MFDISNMQAKYKTNLIKAVQVYADTYFGNKEEVLRSLRPMLEATFVKLAELDENLISPKFLKKGEPNISGIIYYLSGSPKYNRDTDETQFNSDQVLPMYLYYLTDALKNITSKTGMHHYDEASSKYLIKSAVNSFFDYCLWYKKFTKENYLK